MNDQPMKRTVLNWRWWVTLPVIPLALVCFALVVLLHFTEVVIDTLDGVIRAAFQWSRKGWKA